VKQLGLPEEYPEKVGMRSPCQSEMITDSTLLRIPTNQCESSDQGGAVR
jgi:hypothetical protein